MVGSILAGRYTIEALIGEGGMSRVWRALDSNTGKAVAVKVLREEFREDAVFIGRFEREAQAAARMSHPNIANLLDVGIDEGGVSYLVFEYVQGKTLKDHIREHGSLRPEMAAQIIIRVLAALQHAHQNGVVHRDIKPQNILIDREGVVKVSDFGIARVANTQTASQNSETIMGSVYYFSPEQAKGADVDPKSDIYSAGVMFYEMLTGRVPFMGDTPVAIAMKHLREPPIPPSEINSAVSAAMDFVVLHAMAKRPRARYQTAQDMQRDVRLALEHPDTILAARAEMERREREARFLERRKKTTEKRVKWMRRTMVVGFSILLLAVIGLTVSSITDQVLKNRKNSIIMPNVIGLKKEEAFTILTEKNVMFLRNYSSYPLVPEGIIADQSIAPGEKITPETMVTISISESQFDLRLSSYEGMPIEKVHASLNAVGLVGKNEYEVSDASQNIVIAQSPPAGSLMNRGDTVTLTVSAGAVSMPFLTGMARFEVEQAVVAHGLMLSEIGEELVDDPSMVGRVVSQIPQPLERVRPNTSVQVKLGVPSSNMYVTEIVLRLNALKPGETVSVTMDDENGEEVLQYSESFSEADNYSVWPIKLYSQTARMTQYHVYFNDQLQYTAVVVFKP